MSERRKRRPGDRRHHRRVPHHKDYREWFHRSSDEAPVRIPLRCECPEHAADNDRMERLLDTTLDLGQVAVDPVWQIVLVPDVVALAEVTRRPEAADELAATWSARRYDGRVVYVWRLPDDLAA